MVFVFEDIGCNGKPLYHTTVKLKKAYPSEDKQALTAFKDRGRPGY